MDDLAVLRVLRDHEYQGLTFSEGQSEVHGVTRADLHPLMPQHVRSYPKVDGSTLYYLTRLGKLHLSHMEKLIPS